MTKTLLAVELGRQCAYTILIFVIAPGAFYEMSRTGPMLFSMDYPSLL